MTRLEWGLAADKRYEGGVDRGVIYPRESEGVAWNGLISVEESQVGGEREELYFNGRKFLDLISVRNFQGQVQAFGYPKAFGICNGEREVVSGFIITRQQRLRFNFSYRTMINDSDYKIHLVYNVLATQQSRSYDTKSDSVTPSVYQWAFDAVPEPSSVFPAFRPSSHFVIDSRLVTPDILIEVENQLYGTAETPPVMLAAASINDLFGNLIEEPIGAII